MTKISLCEVTFEKSQLNEYLNESMAPIIHPQILRGGGGGGGAGAGGGKEEEEESEDHDMVR